MIIYGSSLSPFARKTLAFAAEKGIEVDWRPTSPFRPDAEFLQCSPFRKVPALRDGDFILSDSTAIITYLEALHPEPALLPADPKDRARTIWYEEFNDTILVPCMGKVFYNRVVLPRFMGQPGDEAMAEQAEKEELPPLIDYLESVLPASGYLVGERLTLADVAVASPFVNFRHLGILPDPARHPRTAAFVDRMHARPSFARLIAWEKVTYGTQEAARMTA